MINSAMYSCIGDTCVGSTEDATGLFRDLQKALGSQGADGVIRDADLTQYQNVVTKYGLILPMYSSIDDIAANADTIVVALEGVQIQEQYGTSSGASKLSLKPPPWWFWAIAAASLTAVGASIYASRRPTRRAPRRHRREATT